MTKGARGQLLGIVVLLVVTAVDAAWAEEEGKPSFWKSLIERGDAKEQGSDEGGSGTKIKEITKVSRSASVVLDKNCPDIVQPYRLTDNLATLSLFAVKETLGSVTRKMLRSSTPVKEDAIPPSTKLAAKQLNWLPMNAEVMYGERLHEDETNILERDTRLGQKHYPTADAMLRELLTKLGEKHDYEFKLFILKNSSRNAVARPGGFLYLDQGLLDDPLTLPKAYFALAHEVSHVLQRHETKELQSMVIDSVATRDDLVKIMTGVKKDPGIILSNVKLKKNLFTRHHVDQELQADSCAAKLLSRVLPDAQGLANALNAFLKDLPPPEPHDARSPPRSDADKLAATVHDIVDKPINRHPTTEERTRNLRAIYDEITKEKATTR